MNEIFIKSSENINIAMNHFKSGHKSVLIIAPGWFMTKDSKPFAEITNVFLRICDVICMDFRGHGASGGFYTFSAKEPDDLEAVVNYAKEKYEKIYLMGFSLGGGIVLIHSALHNNIDKIIAVSPHSNFFKIENQMYKASAWLPTIKKLELKRVFSIRPSLIPHKMIKPIDIIEDVEAPVLFLAGKSDPTVHIWHSKALYKKAKCKKKFEIFTHSAHAEDLFIWEKKKFINLAENWLINE